MKYFSSKFEEYINNCKKHNMHKNMESLYNSMSNDLSKQNNFFGIKSHSESVRKRLADKYGLNVSAGPKYQTEEDIGGKRIKQKS